MEDYMEFSNFSLSYVVQYGNGESGSVLDSFTSVTSTVEPFYSTIGKSVMSTDNVGSGVGSVDNVDDRDNNSLPFFHGSSFGVVNHNQDGFSDLPEGFRVVDEQQWPRIYAYFAVFILSAVGNFCELIWVCRRLSIRNSPVNRLFLHLCIADLLVVFMVAGIEVAWRISIGWYAGNLMCKAVMFFRAFGLYLSSLMIICISLDRYYAVVHPLRVIDASRRVKIMLSSAWITAAVCAIPQCIVFREETHPEFPIFHQCQSLWVHPYIERANTWMSVTMMYFIPLGVIIFAYGSIIIRIAGHLGENHTNSPTFLRRNGMPVFQRAKLRTLKLTFCIVIVFVTTWSPYIIISTWYLIDEKSATRIDGNIQDTLFLMAVANSMANPLVYGCNESCKKRKQRSQSQDPNKEPEHRSDALIMRNYSSYHRCSNKTTVRFSQVPRSAV